MAMIKCKECKSKISDKAKTCPKCGYPIYDKHKFSVKRTIALTAGALLIFVLVIIMYAVNILNSTNPPKFVPNTELQIYENSNIKLQSNQSYSIQLDITQGGTLKPSVVEIYGNNIDFKITKEGSQIYYSGVQTGKASAAIKVTKGRYYLIIMNNNIIESKVVDVTVRMKY